MAQYSINIRKAVRINNFENSDFDLFYEEGVGAKLSNGCMNVQIFKKGALKDYNRAYIDGSFKYTPNQEMIVAISSNAQKIFTIEEYNNLLVLVNKVKALLETENELSNIQKPKPLKKSEIHVGGVYEQEDGSKILFLGNANYYSPSHYDGKFPKNRSKSPYVLVWLNDESTVKYNSDSDTLQFAGTIDSRVGIPNFVKCVKEIELKERDSLDIIEIGSWGSTSYTLKFNEGNNFKNNIENDNESSL